VRFHTPCCILWRVPEQGNTPADAGCYVIDLPCSGTLLYDTSGGTRRCPGLKIAKADIWNHMEGKRLDM
jgi:hypothetical protein